MPGKLKLFKPQLTANINRKGVLDIDTVKGCSLGMAKYPDGGCYGLCYAAKIAKLYRYDFSKSVSRKIICKNEKQLPMFKSLYIGYPRDIFSIVNKHKMRWFRIGTMGDPSHDWELTVSLCNWLHMIKTPVIVTKHWITISDDIMAKLRRINVVINTSISPLDSSNEIRHRLGEFNRLKENGIKSTLRIVSCKFGNTRMGNTLNKVQDKIFKNYPIIDNPLRIPASDKRVISGDIIVENIKDLDKKASISKRYKKSYVGNCRDCPDQCGVL